MNRTKYLSIFLIVVVTMMACNKEKIEDPVNELIDCEEQDCSTCPSDYFFEGESGTEIYIVEEFDDKQIWNKSYSAGEHITQGYENDNIDLTLASDTNSWAEINIDEPGLKFGGKLRANFSGKFNFARFVINSSADNWGDLSFGINENQIVSTTDQFPLYVGDVLIELEKVTLDNGEINTHIGFTGYLHSLVITGKDEIITRISKMELLKPSR